MTYEQVVEKAEEVAGPLPVTTSDVMGVFRVAKTLRIPDEHLEAFTYRFVELVETYGGSGYGELER